MKQKRVFTKRHRKNLRLNHANYRGKNHPQFGTHPSKKTRKKMSIARKKRVTKLETRRKLSLATTGKNNPFYGKKHTIESRLKMSKTHRGKKKKPFTKEHKANISKAIKKRWEDNPDKVAKDTRGGLKVKPNKPEIVIINLLRTKIPKHFCYVGNAKLFIRGFNPDFVDSRNKKIIELYGDYWHNLSDWKERDIRRVKAYKKNGYKLLIIWEHELKDLKKVAQKILKFST